MLVFKTITQESIASSKPWDSCSVWDLIYKHIWFCEKIEFPSHSFLFSTLHIRQYGLDVLVEMQTHDANIK